MTNEKKFLRKILVPVDGSESSLLAEETATIIAKKTGATVTVLHVIPEVEEYYRTLYVAQGLEQNIPHNIIRELLHLTEKEANKIVNDARALIEKQGITVETKILRDIDPSDSIMNFSKKNFDLIIMGARGTNEKEPYALGSVTKKVIRHTTLPTLFVKKACTLSNVLVCIDGSDHSKKALTCFLELAVKVGSKITLLNVQERRLLSASSVIAEELGEHILTKAIGAFEEEEVPIDKKVEFGVASDIIVNVAETQNHDLIVLGSRGLGTVKRFLLGSVSDDVSHKSTCSVLLYPSKNE